MIESFIVLGISGLLWAVSKTDGQRLAEFRLDSPPVWDGMAAAYGCLYLSNQDGSVLCLGPDDRKRAP